VFVPFVIFSALRNSPVIARWLKIEYIENKDSIQNPTDVTERHARYRS